MSGQAMHDQFKAIRESKQSESTVKCVKCGKEFTQENPMSAIAGHCSECEKAGNVS